MTIPLQIYQRLVSKSEMLDILISFFVLLVEPGLEFGRRFSELLIEDIRNRWSDHRRVLEYCVISSDVFFFVG